MTTITTSYIMMSNHHLVLLQCENSYILQLPFTNNNVSLHIFKSYCAVQPCKLTSCNLGSPNTTAHRCTFFLNTWTYNYIPCSLMASIKSLIMSSIIKSNIKASLKASRNSHGINQVSSLHTRHRSTNKIIPPLL